MDCLKSELMSRGLKCGGTLQQRAQRLFATKNVPLDKLDPSLFAKAPNGRKNGKKWTALFHLLWMMGMTCQELKSRHFLAVAENQNKSEQNGRYFNLIWTFKCWHTPAYLTVAVVRWILVVTCVEVLHTNYYFKKSCFSSNAFFCSHHRTNIKISASFKRFEIIIIQ